MGGGRGRKRKGTGKGKRREGKEGLFPEARGECGSACCGSGESAQRVRGSAVKLHVQTARAGSLGPGNRSPFLCCCMCMLVWCAFCFPGPAVAASLLLAALRAARAICHTSLKGKRPKRGARGPAIQVSNLSVRAHGGRETHLSITGTLHIRIICGFRPAVPAPLLQRGDCSALLAVLCPVVHVSRQPARGHAPRAREDALVLESVAALLKSVL